MKYEDFLFNRMQVGNNDGFEPIFLPDFLFDFQKYLVSWAIEKGRGALFEDCGLGKTPQQLVWAENVYRHTGKPVIIFAPLAVSAQTLREAEKFNIDCSRSHDGQIKSNIVITNYEKIDLFDCSKFGGVVCDESSILKNFDGAFKQKITIFMRKIQYRLLATATAAPNDYTELGTSSEALGYLGFVDMLTKFFKNDNNNISAKRYFGEAPQWRFKGHSELPFWRWVTSWARACRKPSDIGFKDEKFILPKLIENEHYVHVDPIALGRLFNPEAVDLREQRKEKKETIVQRCEMVKDIIDTKKGQSLVWCQLNEEGDYLEKILGAEQVSGKDNDDKKEKKFLDFANGDIKVLVTKPKIGALGMNWQNCAHMVYFPSHSYEQYYQAVRRCWRFGQKNDVVVDVILSEGEKRILDNLKRKNKAATNMFNNLVSEMNNAVGIKNITKFEKKEILPTWL